MPRLDGTWRLERTGGLLPPMVGLRKVIAGSTGETRLGRLPGIRFDVDGLALRYRAPFSPIVDFLVPDGDGFRGRATVFGRQVGEFRLRRASSHAD